MMQGFLYVDFLAEKGNRFIHKTREIYFVSKIRLRGKTQDLKYLSKIFVSSYSPKYCLLNIDSPNTNTVLCDSPFPLTTLGQLKISD
jgi:hypothetical protein